MIWRYLGPAVCVVAVVLVAFGVVGPRTASGMSPGKVAGLYVKSLAESNGVRILGDKVWSIRHLKDGRLLVAVRVRYLATPTFMGIPVGEPQLGVTTIFVHEAYSNWQVAG